MEIKEYEQLTTIGENEFLKCNMDNILYFDIETTGFDRQNHSIILISLGKFSSKNRFRVKQYFADDLKDEKDILYEFSEDIRGENIWCSYNGIAFDEPFIKERMNQSSICFISPRYHVDLYRIIRPYYRQLGMERCNLKTVEKYIGINRKDKINGGISVNLYEEFLSSKDSNIKNTIMLHNYEDVLNLPKIHEFAIKIKEDKLPVRKDCITEKQLKYLKVLLKKNNLNLNIQLNKLSKKAASHSIEYLLKGEKNAEELVNIINNSY